MHESFVYCQRVHLTAMLIRPVLNGRFQVMSRSLDSQRIGDGATGALLVLHPCWMRQRNPNGASADQKFYVNSVSVPRGYCHDQSLIHTVKPLPSPAVYSVEVLIHNLKLYRTPVRQAMITTQRITVM
jgi:hypothetical protein